MNNKGYSLLEAIIIVVILGVIAGFMMTSSGLLDGRRTKACADNISSLLEKVRATNLGKDEVTITIYEDTGKGIKADIVTKVKAKNPSDPDKLSRVTEDVGNDNMEISYSTDLSGSSPVLLGSGSMEFSFNRSTGSVKSTTPSGIKCIIVRRGNAEKKIKIYTETGKVSVE